MISFFLISFSDSLSLPPYLHHSVTLPTLILSPLPTLILWLLSSSLLPLPSCSATASPPFVHVHGSDGRHVGAAAQGHGGRREVGVRDPGEMNRIPKSRNLTLCIIMIVPRSSAITCRTHSRHNIIVILRLRLNMGLFIT
jgi:hypothetical protein